MTDLATNTASLAPHLARLKAEGIATALPGRM